MKRLRWMMWGMLSTVALGLAGGLTYMYSGFYNVAASTDHTAVVYWVLEQGMRASVRRHARDAIAPVIDESTLQRGARCFDINCAQCHGAPGRSPAAIGKGMSPIANSLVQTAREWPLEEIYWVTRHGIRMAGMPAWGYRLGEAELWSIAAFVDQELPLLTVEQYDQRLEGAAAERCEVPTERAPPDAERGVDTMRQYGCHGCHVIPGITGPDVQVGPTLAGFAKRPLIAGRIPNTPANVMQWLREPQALRPRTLMPDLAVTAQHAADMQAYLATLE